jgi:DNA replication and repair protein RecF
MRLTALHLENFRSYEERGVSFDPGITILLGPNAAGKTNLIEAIAVLSLGASPIAAEEEHLFRWGSESYRIAARLEKDCGEAIDLEIISQSKPRKAKVARLNGVRKHQSDMHGILPIVLFLPSDLHLFTGPPELRRRWLNQILCQVSPLYRLVFDEYRRVLKQRNALLKQLATDREQLTTRLQPWDEKVAELGSQIIAERRKLVATMNLSLKGELAMFGEIVTEVRMEYEHHGASPDAEELKSQLLEELKRAHERDIILQATTVGPHRDDWTLLIQESKESKESRESKDIAAFASRGQQRAAILALSMLQASYLELKMNEKPVLLLDDVFSELDEEHERSVLQACSRYQTLVTATHLPERMPKDVDIKECPIVAVHHLIEAKPRKYGLNKIRNHA